MPSILGVNLGGLTSTTPTSTSTPTLISPVVVTAPVLPISTTVPVAGGGQASRNPPAGSGTPTAPPPTTPGTTPTVAVGVDVGVGGVDLLAGLNLGGAGTGVSIGVGVTTPVLTVPVVTTPVITTPVISIGPSTPVMPTPTPNPPISTTPVPNPSTPTGGGSTAIDTGGGGDPNGGSRGGGAGGGASPALPNAHTAYMNIFRIANAADISASVSSQLDQLDRMVTNHTLTAQQAILQIANAAAGSTAVAETMYQFFTGLTPTSPGLDYLVHSTANPNDLSDSYYANFNLENRYINFASNLGLYSDYSPGFAATFGNLSFDQAVRTAYDRIVGADAAALSGINPETAIRDVEARKPYFEAVATERFGAADHDLSTKLAAVAYIMEEAVRANVGHYGEANQNFLYDLADGQAQFHVNLVATYGHGTPLDVIG